jgi:hypothetical protein
MELLAHLVKILIVHIAYNPYRSIDSLRVPFAARQDNDALISGILHTRFTFYRVKLNPVTQ